MKSIYFALIFIYSISCHSQNLIEWDRSVKLELSDFQSVRTNVGSGDMYSLSVPAQMQFSFHMSTYEFMFTKNFNSKAVCNFNKSAAIIVAPTQEIASSLLSFARFEFDLCELYIRKVRQNLYETKGAFSDVNFFQPVFDKFQNEYVEKTAAAQQETDLGQNAAKLDSLHQQVIAEIDALADFCKTCKPPKRNRERKK